jgi:hypothetical protein
MGQKKIENLMLRREPITRKSITEMGFAKANDMGIKPQIGKQGQPTLYNPEMMPPQAFIMCAQYGATFEELGKIWGVTATTVSDWVKRHEDFAAAVRNGRDAFNVGQIEQSLVKRAMGMEYDEVQTEEVQYKVKTIEGTVLVPAVKKVVTRKVIMPDVAAIIFYLKNRAPERWRDRMDVFSLTGSIGDVKAKLETCDIDALRDLRNTIKSVVSSQLTIGMEN